MSFEELRSRLEQAKYQFNHLLYDLDRLKIPSAEKDALADRFDQMSGECESIIEDVDDLERWIT